MKVIGIIALLCSVANASPVLVNGAGSTFAEPLYTKWNSVYQKKDPNSQFNYQGVGSGAGMKQLIAGTVDFAGSDDPMSAEDSAKAKSNVIHVPIAMGAVVASYNMDFKGKLRLSGPVLAKIFNGQIKKWDDKEIKELNPKLSLPNTDIAVVTRSDGSGTTAIFSDYLAKVSPDWVGKNGKTVNWFQGSLGAKGNAGVAGLIKQTPGAIGYVELVYALENKLAFAELKNKAGNFVDASAKTVSNAAQGITDEAIKKDFKISITDSAQKDAYPISAFTWMLVYGKMAKEKGASVVAYAKWTLSEDAQKVSEGINFAPVPKTLRAAALKSLEKVQLE